jgi:hypothetical protein
LPKSEEVICILRDHEICGNYFWRILVALVGWVSPDGSGVAPEVYEKNALAIADEVCKCLRDEGFEVDWDGNFARKIGLSLNWQRRTLLE